MQKSFFTRLLLLSLSISLLSSPALAQTRCDAEIEEAVNRYDLENKTIHKQFVTKTYSAGRNGSGVSNYDVWVSFNECSGNMIIRLGRSCQFETAYTKGECSVKGLKNY